MTHSLISRLSFTALQKASPARAPPVILRLSKTCVADEIANELAGTIRRKTRLGVQPPCQNAPLSRYDASTGLLGILVFLISASKVSDWLGGH